MILVFQLIHHEAHVEIAAGTQQIHELHHLPLGKIENIVEFNGNNDFLEDKFCF